MRSQAVYAETEAGLSRAELRAALQRSLGDCAGLRKVLLLPPDFTRFHSAAGTLTQLLCELLPAECQVDIMPALGTHTPVTRAQWEKMFAGIPYEKMIVHNWRTDTKRLGCVPAEVVARLSEGTMAEPIDVELNARVVDPSYDLVLSIGQVVPHEVVGMANRNKNLFVGCGGIEMINRSHMLGALYGLERIMGRDHTPVRELYDYAEAHFLQNVPLCYLLTVTTARGEDAAVHGLFIGRERSRFEEAVALAREKNVIHLDRKVRRAVVWLDPSEYKTTWLGNKAVYRTRKAIADGGELLVLAPGVAGFAEDAEIDPVLRRYGYCGREEILRLLRRPECADLRENLSAAAHLIHGSSDGRFTITYCTRALSDEEMEQVHYRSLPYDEAVRRYDPEGLTPGWNTLPDGEEIYFIPNPALGLWEA